MFVVLMVFMVSPPRPGSGRKKPPQHEILRAGLAAGLTVRRLAESTRKRRAAWGRGDGTDDAQDAEGVRELRGGPTLDRIRFMAKKSDKTRSARRRPDRERRISATEASRSFSLLLDEVERGYRFLVERHGRLVCLMTPPSGRGRRASECLALLRSRPPVLLDDGFSADLLVVLAQEPVEDRPQWDS
jgi:antitoxin (DNA-binding transcriptional repressor) of toxin-antitoxin stability system